MSRLGHPDVIWVHDVGERIARPGRCRQPLVHHGPDLIGEPASLAGVVGHQRPWNRQATLGGVAQLHRLVLGEGDVGGMVEPPRDRRDDPAETLPGLPRRPEPPLLRHMLGEAERARPPIVGAPNVLQRDLVVPPCVPIGVHQPPGHTRTVEPGDQRELLREVSRVAAHHRHVPPFQLADHQLGGRIDHVGQHQHRSLGSTGHPYSSSYSVRSSALAVVGLM